MKVLELKGKTMTIVLRSDDIVETIENKGWDQPDTLEIAKGDLAIIRKVIDGQPRGLLIETPSRYTSKVILDYYQNTELGAIARALILNSFAAKVVGNLYLKLSKGKSNEAGRIVPTKLFTDKEAGEKWLLKKIKEHKNNLETN